MRKSLQKTTVAALRTFIDAELKKAERPEKMGQAEFGAIIHKPRPTVQKLENGTLPLSEKTAREISQAFGVSLSWLLEGKPTARMVEAPNLYAATARAEHAAEWKKYMEAHEIPAEKPRKTQAVRLYTLESFDRAQFSQDWVSMKPFGLAGAAYAFQIDAEFEALCDLIREMKKDWQKGTDREFRLWRLKRAIHAIREEFPAGA